MRLGPLALLALLPFVVATCDQLSVVTPSTPVISPSSGVLATQQASSAPPPSLRSGSISLGSPTVASSDSASLTAPAAELSAALSLHLPEPDLARYGWLRFQASTEGQGTEGPSNPAGDILVDLEAGTLDGGSTARIHLREPTLPPAAAPHAAPFASGPFNNVALYGFWRPNVSELHRLDLLTGDDTLVYRHGHVIDGAAFSGASGDTFFSLVSRTTGADLGVYRMTAPLISSLRVLPPDPALSAARTSVRRLWLTPDGSLLVVIGCVTGPSAPGCTATVATVAGEIVRKIANVDPLPLGLTNDTLIQADSRIDLRTGTRRALPRHCGTPRTAIGLGATWLVYASVSPVCGGTRYEVTVQDLRSGTTRVLWRDNAFRVGTDRELLVGDAQVNVPISFVPLFAGGVIGYPNARTPQLISLGDGSAVDLGGLATDPLFAAPSRLAPPQPDLDPTLRHLLESTSWAGGAADGTWVIGNLFGSWRRTQLRQLHVTLVPAGPRLIALGRDPEAPFAGLVDGLGHVTSVRLPAGRSPSEATFDPAHRRIFVTTIALGEDDGVWAVDLETGGARRILPAGLPRTASRTLLTAVGSGDIVTVLCTTAGCREWTIDRDTLVATALGRPFQAHGAAATVLLGAVPSRILGPWQLYAPRSGAIRTMTAGLITERGPGVVVDATHAVITGIDRPHSLYRLGLLDLRTGSFRSLLSTSVHDQRLLAPDLTSARFALLYAGDNTRDAVDLRAGTITADAARFGPGS